MSAQDYEGNPISRYVQMDAVEFMCMLLQYVESALPVATQVLDSTLTHELVADSQYRSYDDTFTPLSVRVEHLKVRRKPLVGYYCLRITLQPFILLQLRAVSWGISKHEC